MNWFEKWFLKRVFKKQVQQGVFHHSNIMELYSMIGEAAKTEFREDNNATLKYFLTDCFNKAFLKIKDN